MRSVTPVAFIRLPAMMKNGTAVSEALLTPSSICCGMICSAVEKSEVRKVRTVAVPMAMEMGTRMRISAMKVPKRIQAIGQTSG